MGMFCDVADFAAAHNAGGKQLQDSWSTLCAAADRRLSARHKRQRQHIVLQLRLGRLSRYRMLDFVTKGSGVS